MFFTSAGAASSSVSSSSPVAPTRSNPIGIGIETRTVASVGIDYTVGRGRSGEMRIDAGDVEREVACARIEVRVYAEEIGIYGIGCSWVGTIHRGNGVRVHVGMVGVAIYILLYIAIVASSWVGITCVVVIVVPREAVRRGDP